MHFWMVYLLRQGKESGDIVCQVFVFCFCLCMFLYIFQAKTIFLKLG